MIKYSIVICERNENRKVVETIRQINKQKGERCDIEIVVIDDKSTDDTVALLKREKIDKLIVNEENRGISYSRNIGVASAKGSVVVFFDAHIRFPNGSKTFLSVLDDLFNKYPQVAGISGHYYSKSQRDANYLRDIIRRHYRFKEAGDFIIDRSNFTTISSCVFAIKREIVEKYSFPLEFKGVAAEDTFFQLMIMKEGIKILHSRSFAIIHDAEIDTIDLLRKIIYQCRGTHRLYARSLRVGIKDIPFSSFYLDFPLVTFLFFYLSLISIVFGYFFVLNLLLASVVVDFFETRKILGDSRLSFRNKVSAVIYILLNEGIKIIDWPISVFREKYTPKSLFILARIYVRWEVVKIKRILSVKFAKKLTLNNLISKI